MISLFSPLPWIDLGRTLRLLINVILMISVVHWTIRMNNAPLLFIVFGFFAGTLVNLMMSFKYPYLVYGVMRLSGQNTPGVAMGVGIT